MPPELWANCGLWGRTGDPKTISVVYLEVLQTLDMSLPQYWPPGSYSSLRDHCGEFERCMGLSVIRVFSGLGFFCVCFVFRLRL